MCEKGISWAATVRGAPAHRLWVADIVLTHHPDPQMQVKGIPMANSAQGDTSRQGRSISRSRYNMQVWESVAGGGPSAPATLPHPSTQIHTRAQVLEPVEERSSLESESTAQLHLDMDLDQPAGRV